MRLLSFCAVQVVTRRPEVPKEGILEVKVYIGFCVYTNGFACMANQFRLEIVPLTFQFNTDLLKIQLITFLFVHLYSLQFIAYWFHRYL